MNTSTVLTDARIEYAVRQRYSPMPELTMRTLGDALNQFRIGELRRAARMWEVMIERDGELMANVTKRCADVARLEYDIQTADESDAAKRHADALRYAYDNIRARHALDQDDAGGIRSLIRQIVLAHANRYSVHELTIRIDNAARKEVTYEATHCPVWFFEARRGRLGYLPNEAALYGTPMLTGEWLVAVGHGFMRPACVAYLSKWLSAGSWMLFAQRFGLPGIQGKTTAALGTPEWDAFEQALLKFAGNWIAVTNKDADINLIEAKGGSSSSLPFPGLMEYSDKLYAKLFRGSDLATQSADKGSVGASLQVDEKDAFLADDAEWINETLNQGIDRPLIRYLFDEEPLAYFRLSPPRRLSIDSDIKAAEFLLSHDVKLGKRSAVERMGWTEAADDEEPLGEAPEPAEPAVDPTAEPSAAGRQANPAAEEDPSAIENETGIAAKARARFGKALADDLAPLRRRLAAIEQITDPEIRRARLRALLDQWSSLQEDILADPEAAQAMTEIQGTAMVDGLTGTKAPGSP